MVDKNIDKVWAQLRDDRVRVSSRILGALDRPNRETTRAFAACFAELKPERRREIVEVLADTAEEDFHCDYADLFRTCLQDSDPEVRRGAISGLWEAEDVDLARAFVQIMTGDSDPLVRAAAATGLGKFVWLDVMEEIDKRVAKRVREALLAVAQNRGEDLEVVRRAIESLGWLDGDEIRKLIDYAYTHPDPRMRVTALFAMGRNAEAIWEETVLSHIDDTTLEVRYEAVRAAGEMHLQRAIGPVIQALNGRDAEIKEVAIWALGEIGGDRARNALQRMTKSLNEELAAAAEEALDNMLLSEAELDLLAFDIDEELEAAEEAVAEDAKEGESLDDEDDEDKEEDAEEDEEGEWPDEFLGVR